jgi:glycolate oxidase
VTDRSRETINLLRRSLPEGMVRVEPSARLAYSSDSTFQQRIPDAVVSANSTDDVQTVMRIANTAGVPVVIRGAGSGLSGGAIPVDHGIVLDLIRMDRLLEIDLPNGMAVVEPGLVTADLHEQVEAQGLMYPPDPASLGQSTIGGNLATNAGGPRGVKYGVTRDYVKGLTVVLANGTRLELGGKTLKNATGYQLLHLFVGSEGTLGAITQATLKLIPLPRFRRTAAGFFPSLDVASEAVTGLLLAGGLPVTLEMMDRTSLEITEEALGFPLAAEHQAMLLVEVDGNHQHAVGAEIEAMAEAMAENGASYVRVARDDSERERLWRARRSVSRELGQRAPSRLGEDIVVPRSRIPEMVRRVGEISREHGFPIAVFGHAGDGNLHPSFLFDMDREGELGRLEVAAAAVFRAAMDLGGTLSGEHGIGTLKREFMEEAVGRDALELMRQVKALLDPRGILNPHKIFPSNPDSTGSLDGFLTALPTLRNATPDP